MVKKLTNKSGLKIPRAFNIALKKSEPLLKEYYDVIASMVLVEVSKEYTQIQSKKKFNLFEKYFCPQKEISLFYKENNWDSKFDGKIKKHSPESISVEDKLRSSFSGILYLSLEDEEFVYCPDISSIKNRRNSLVVIDEEFLGLLLESIFDLRDFSNLIIERGKITKKSEDIFKEEFSINVENQLRSYLNNYLQRLLLLEPKQFVANYFVVDYLELYFSDNQISTLSIAPSRQFFEFILSNYYSDFFGTDTINCFWENPNNLYKVRQFQCDYNQDDVDLELVLSDFLKLLNGLDFSKDVEKELGLLKNILRFSLQFFTELFDKNPGFYFEKALPKTKQHLIDIISKDFKSIVYYYKEQDEDLLSDVISAYNNNVVVQYCRSNVTSKNDYILLDINSFRTCWTKESIRNFITSLEDDNVIDLDNLVTISSALDFIKLDDRDQTRNRPCFTGISINLPPSTEFISATRKYNAQQEIEASPFVKDSDYIVQRLKLLELQVPDIKLLLSNLGFSFNLQQIKFKRFNPSLDKVDYIYLPDIITGSDLLKIEKLDLPIKFH